MQWCKNCLQNKMGLNAEEVNARGDWRCGPFVCPACRCASAPHGTPRPHAFNTPKLVHARLLSTFCARCVVLASTRWSGLVKIDGVAGRADAIVFRKHENHTSDDDGVLDERRFAPLPRAGITNLAWRAGKHLFSQQVVNSSVQHRARPLIAARSAITAGTLACSTSDIALRGAR